MCDMLVQGGMHKALAGKKKIASMTNEVWENPDARSFRTIQLCLEDEVFF